MFKMFNLFKILKVKFVATSVAARRVEKNLLPRCPGFKNIGLRDYPYSFLRRSEARDDGYKWKW